MRKQRISEVIGNIDSRYIDEATGFTGRMGSARRKTRYKWLAAACFAFALAIGIPLARNLFISRDHKQTIDTVMLIEYEHAYFEIIEDPAIAERFGLEREVTGELIGNHIAYLQKKIPEAKRGDYIAAESETSLELLEYAPAPYKAVRIFRDGGKYYFAFFCNYLVDTNEFLPIQSAFEVYGIGEASDIVSITPVTGGSDWEPRGESVTDPAAISGFFGAVSELPAVSFDDFHALTFDAGSEVYTRVADDRKDLVIETKDGLRFGISYYPSYGWLNVSATMSYYPISPELSDWLATYLP